MDIIARKGSYLFWVLSHSKLATIICCKSISLIEPIENKFKQVHVLQPMYTCTALFVLNQIPKIWTNFPRLNL